MNVRLDRLLCGGDLLGRFLLHRAGRHLAPTIVRDTDFTPSHIIEFYLSYPIYIITGGAAFLYAKTRLPFFGRAVPAVPDPGRSARS